MRIIRIKMFDFKNDVLHKVTSLDEITVKLQNHTDGKFLIRSSIKLLITKDHERENYRILSVIYKRKISTKKPKNVANLYIVAQKIGGFSKKTELKINNAQKCLTMINETNIDPKVFLGVDFCYIDITNLTETKYEII